MHDFMIIGGGIAGLAAAARLAPYGKVVLLEAESHTGYHASGRSAALYEPYYGAPAVKALSLASGPFFRTLAGLLTPRGLMMVATHEQEAEFAHDSADMNLTPITFATAQAIVPILNPKHAALIGYADHAWDIDTDLLMTYFAKTARSYGAEIVVQARVSGLMRQGKIWAAQTPLGRFTAKVVINAAGPWADIVAQMAGVDPLGLVAMRRSMARVPAPAGLDLRNWPMMFGVGESWYAKPDAGALIVSPADEEPMPPHDAFADDMVLAEGLARFEHMVTTPITRVLTSWAGLRTFAPDRVPVIGPDPAAEGFYWAAGLGGYGFQTADGASRLLADLVLGRSSQFDGALMALLAPARFR